MMSYIGIASSNTQAAKMVNNEMPNIHKPQNVMSIAYSVGL